MRCLLVLATLLGCSILTTRAADPSEIPEGARAIVASSPYVKYLGAIPDVAQTGVRWMLSQGSMSTIQLWALMSRPLPMSR